MQEHKKDEQTADDDQQNLERDDHDVLPRARRLSARRLKDTGRGTGCPATGPFRTRRPGEGKPAALRSGVLSSAVLFEGADERVVIEEWRAGAPVEIPNPEGLELLLLAGSFQEDQDMLVPLSWMRLPPGQDFHALSGPGGARVWYKQAPLLHRNVCAFDDAQAGKTAF